MFWEVASTDLVTPHVKLRMNDGLASLEAVRSAAGWASDPGKTQQVPAVPASGSPFVA